MIEKKSSLIVLLVKSKKFLINEEQFIPEPRENNSWTTEYELYVPFRDQSADPDSSEEVTTDRTRTNSN